MITSLLAVVLSLFEPADTTITLQGVTVSGQRQRDFQMRSSQSAVQISHDYLQQHFSGSLMQTLEGVPGVKAMAIGSGQSKPTIRGLGFNRLAVTEDGIKHEGQQWGDDHGLEIDQFAVDRAEVIKGPAALLYGSDAIGGVLYSCLVAQTMNSWASRPRWVDDWATGSIVPTSRLLTMPTIRCQPIVFSITPIISN